MIMRMPVQIYCLFNTDFLGLYYEYSTEKMPCLLTFHIVLAHFSSRAREIGFVDPVARSPLPQPLFKFFDRGA